MLGTFFKVCYTRTKTEEFLPWHILTSLRSGSIYQQVKRQNYCPLLDITQIYFLFVKFMHRLGLWNVVHLPLSYFWVDNMLAEMRSEGPHRCIVLYWTLYKYQVQGGNLTNQVDKLPLYAQTHWKNAALYCCCLFFDHINGSHKSSKLQYFCI